MRLPLVGDQHFLLEPTETGVDIGGLLMEVADHPGAISSNRDAKWITSTESAFFVQVDYKIGERKTPPKRTAEGRQSEALNTQRFDGRKILDLRSA